MRFRVCSFTCVLEASSQELFSWCFDGAFCFRLDVTEIV